MKILRYGYSTGPNNRGPYCYYGPKPKGHFKEGTETLAVGRNRHEGDITVNVVAIKGLPISPGYPIPISNRTAAKYASIKWR